jgi:hypothetical protein
MPREVAVEHGQPLGDMTDDEINALLDHVRALRATLIEQPAEEKAWQVTTPTNSQLSKPLLRQS